MVGEEHERQARVARLATARGYSVLALRGTQGQVLGSRSSPRGGAGRATSATRRTARRSSRAGRSRSARHERRARPTRRVLLGFSNGGYFAALIASRALAPFDAVAIAHAGPVQPMTPAGAMPPILLVDADDDPSGAGDVAPRLPTSRANRGRTRWWSARAAMRSRSGTSTCPSRSSTASRRERLPLVPPPRPAACDSPGHDASAPRRRIRRRAYDPDRAPHRPAAAALPALRPRPKPRPRAPTQPPPPDPPTPVLEPPP